MYRGFNGGDDRSRAKLPASPRVSCSSAMVLSFSFDFEVWECGCEMDRVVLEEVLSEFWVGVFWLAGRRAEGWFSFSWLGDCGGFKKRCF